MKQLARIISFIFHPLIMPTIGLLVIFISGLNFTYFTAEQKRIIFLTIFLSTYIIPLSFMPFFLLKKSGFQIEMSSARDRLIPFFITSAVYFIVCYFLRKIGIPEFLFNYIFASAVAVLLTTIITVFWKISVHLVGVGGLVGLLFFISYFFNADVFSLTFVAFLLAGLIGSSRLALHAHSLMQVLSGFALGMFTVFLSLFILS